MISPAVLKLFGIEDPASFVGEKVTFRILIPANDGTTNNTEVIIDKEFTVRGITKEEGVLNAMMMLPELRNYVGIEEFERIQVRVDTSENLPIVENKLTDTGYRVTALKDGRASLKDFRYSDCTCNLRWYCARGICDWYV